MPFHVLGGDTECATRDELSHLIAPYTFPLLIEFCVAASIIVISVWDQCGKEHHHESPSHPRNRQSSTGIAAPVALTTATMSARARDKLYGVADRRLTLIAEDNNLESLSKLDNFTSDVESYTAESTMTSLDNRPIILVAQKNKKLYYNNHVGFIFGWILMTTVIVIVIIYSYHIYSHIGYTEGLETAIYTTDITLCVICLVAIVITAKQMSKLSYKDDELKKARKEREGRADHNPPKGINVDSNLLYQTTVSLMAFQILSMMSAIDQSDFLIFSASMSQLIFSVVQTIFINWYASNKRITKIDHFYTKPGRQGLELLRTTNLSLWLVNTFLLENTEAKRFHWESFGHEGWTILSNIFQPLTILYHFHAMVCYADIIVHSYSSKYIGLQRKKIIIPYAKEGTSSTDSSSITNGEDAAIEEDFATVNERNNTHI